MKFKFVMSLLAAGLLQAAPAQTALFYVNDGVVQAPPIVPPNIDAVNFVNNNLFELNINAGFFGFTGNPYYTANTLNYTNFGTMYCDVGFEFRTFDPDADFGQQFRWASSFHNAGTISSGGVAGFFGVAGGSKLFIYATNIYNPGTLEVSQNSFISLEGDNVNLNRATISMEGFNDFLPGNLAGLYDGYWNMDTNEFGVGGVTAAVPFSPLHQVQTRQGAIAFEQLVLPTAIVYSDELQVGDSNLLTRIVVVQNTNTAINVNVYFPLFGDILVEWAWTNRPFLGRPASPDYLYLLDSLGVDNVYGLVQNGFAGFYPTFIPLNYSFFRGGPFNFGQPAVPGLNVAVPLGTATNRWSAYQAILRPTTSFEGDIFGQNATNMAGRVSIDARQMVDLRHARVFGANTLELTSTNEALFQGLEVGTPLASINLRSSSGNITLTNLIAPNLPRPEGTISLWSGKFSEEQAGVTNTYHILFVESEVTPNSSPRIQDIKLTADNLVISDVLNIRRFFHFDARSITVTTNGEGAYSPAGAINLESPATIWASSTPRLAYLTNEGTISTRNATYFGATRMSQYYNTLVNAPYEVFINTGNLIVESATIFSRYFESPGLIQAYNGSVSVDAVNAFFREGVITAPGGDVNLKASTLVISNTPIRAGRILTLNASTYLDDGGLTNGNVWVVGGSSSSVPGLVLPVRPATSSLMGTTITNIAGPHASSRLVWAGEDRGASVAGYFNNAAINHLVLDAQDAQSVYNVSAAAGINALYVKTLELRNFATNRDANGNLIALNIQPGMRIYFAQAIAQDVGDVSDKLNGVNGGRLIWVSSYPLNDPPVGLTSPPPPAVVVTPPPSGTDGQTSTGGSPQIRHPGSPSSTGGPTLAVAEAAGEYYGLIHDDAGLSQGRAGYLYVNLSPRKTFTAKAVLGKSHYSVSGRVGDDGKATAQIRGTSITVEFQFDLTNGERVVGSIHLPGGVEADFVADKRVFSRRSPYINAGYYTFLIAPPESANPAVTPAGYGYGSARIDATGIVKWSAILADGAKVSGQTAVSREGVWPLYSSLYNGKGMALAWVQVKGLEAAGIVGETVWIKEQGASAVSYPAGFTNEVSLVGSSYSAPARNQKVLNLGASQAVFSGATLQNPITVSTTLDSNNRVRAVSGQMSLSISQATGLFRGNVRDAASGRVLPFSGIIDQKGGFGAGCFTKDYQSGQVWFGPATN